MMKSIILSIGLISTINASSQRLLQQTGCELVRCGSGTFCTEDPIAGAQCVSCAATTCPQGQTCEEGVGCTDITCGSFEEYNFCGSACPAVCGQEPRVCIAVCVPGCFCQDGYIRDENGRCILESECQSSGCTKPNEVFSTCSGHCRPTCETGLNIICTLQCEAGCVCDEGFILDQADGTCIPVGDCPAETNPECPLRCETGFLECNDCFCDGLGGPGGCTRKGCPDGNGESGCKKCEVGYTVNALTNECESAKVKCTNNGDCDAGFKCRKDPECRAYSDLACADTGKVCVAGRRTDICSSDNDCDTTNGFACLDGDVGDGKCVKYQ